MDASTSITAASVRERFVGAYGRFPSPLLLLSPNGTILAANAAVAAMFESAPRQLEGVYIDALAARDADQVHRFLFLCSRSSEFLPGAVEWQLPSGQVLRTRCEGSAASLPGENLYPPGSVLLRVLPNDVLNARFHTLNETIDRLASEIHERGRTEALLAGQNEVLQLIAQGRPLDETLTRLTTVIEQYAGDGLIASILLLDRDGIHLRHGAAPSLPDAYCRTIDGIAIGPNVGSCGTAAFTRKPVIVADIAADPLWTGFREIALEHGLRSCWSTPIPDDTGQVLGTFAFYHREPRTPAPQELNLVALATRTAGIAILRSRAAENQRNLLDQQSAILNTLPAAVALLDRDGSVIAVNENWKSVMEASKNGSCIGRNYVRECLPRISAPPETLRDLQSHLSCVIDRGEQFSVEFQSVDPPDRWWYVIACPLQRGPEHKPGAVVMHLDISDRKRAESELLLNAESLAKANSDLQQFAYVASHDLREPLRTIKSFSQLLERRHSGALPSEGREFLAYIADAVDRMDSLLRDLLDFSRAVHNPAPDRDTVELDRPCRTALRNLQALIEDSHAFVRVGRLPAARIHEVRIAQVFQNLIANAIKYTNGRRPEVLVDAQTCGAEVTVSITDNGVGIAPEYREAIFAMFKRLHARDVPGTGLGLALCKRIVESHGGRIWVEAAPVHGSVFRFTVPAALQEACA